MFWIFFKEGWRAQSTWQARRCGSYFDWPAAREKWFCNPQMTAKLLAARHVSEWNAMFLKWNDIRKFQCFCCQMSRKDLMFHQCQSRTGTGLFCFGRKCSEKNDRTFNLMSLCCLWSWPFCLSKEHTTETHCSKTSVWSAQPVFGEIAPFSVVTCFHVTHNFTAQITMSCKKPKTQFGWCLQ